MKKIILGALTAMLVLGLAGAVTLGVRAQTETPPATPTEEPSEATEDMMDWGPWMRGNQHMAVMHNVLVAKLAEATGKSVAEISAELEAGKSPFELATAAGLTADELRALIAGARDEALSAAVSAGSLTQEEADSFKAAQLNAGARLAGATFIVKLAEATGLSVTDIDAKMLGGEDPHSIAAAAGLSDEQFSALLKAAIDEVTSAAVAAGGITQEQAEMLKAGEMGMGYGFGMYDGFDPVEGPMWGMCGHPGMEGMPGMMGKHGMFGGSGMPGMMGDFFGKMKGMFRPGWFNQPEEEATPAP